MKLKLNTLTIDRFKGIQSLDWTFDPVINQVTGDNATGKTTVMDAWLWLLFGKDSQNAIDFNIKTLDPDGNVLDNKYPHSVSAVVMFDDYQVKLTKIYREKWTKRRGSEQEEMSGHTTEYFWNDVPVTMTEYNQKLSQYISEDLAKLITNPMYFHSLKWEVKRDILIKLIGGVNNQDIMQNLEGDTTELAQAMAQNKSPEEYGRQLASQRTKIKQELDTMPTRIEELQKAVPTIDRDQLAADLEAHKHELQQINDAINDTTKAYQQQLDEIMQNQKQLHELEKKYGEDQNRSKAAIRDEVTVLYNKINEQNAQVQKLKSQIRIEENYVSVMKAECLQLEKLMADLRTRWTKTNDQQPDFKTVLAECPSCNRPFDLATVEQEQETIRQNFNRNKVETLTRITEEGKQKKVRHEELQKEIQSVNEKIEVLTGQIDGITSHIEETKKEIGNAEAKPYLVTEEMTALKSQIDAWEKPVAPDKPDISHLQTKQKAVQLLIDECNKQIGSYDQGQQLKSRIEELMQQEQGMASRMAEIERLQYILEQFQMERIKYIDQRVNAKFQYVRFKLFNIQINGGIDQTCEATVNGVPYSDLNTASKINAGVDVINALTMHYDTYAPVFIDHAESINNIIPLRTQTIRLIVGAPGTPLTLN